MVAISILLKDWNHGGARLNYDMGSPIHQEPIRNAGNYSNAPSQLDYGIFRAHMFLNRATFKVFILTI
jgi:hypothetical protein